MTDLSDRGKRRTMPGFVHHSCPAIGRQTARHRVRSSRATGFPVLCLRSPCGVAFECKLVLARLAQATFCGSNDTRPSAAASGPLLVSAFFVVVVMSLPEIDLTGLAQHRHCQRTLRFMICGRYNPSCFAQAAIAQSSGMSHTAAPAEISLKPAEAGTSHCTIASIALPVPFTAELARARDSSVPRSIPGGRRAGCNRRSSAATKRLRTDGLGCRSLGD
jgi:hypothetical protein